MSIYTTIIAILDSFTLWVPIVVLLWLNVAFVVLLHRGNIKRLINGNENKVNFREKVFGKFKKKETKNEQVQTQSLETEEENDKTTTD